MIRKRVEKFETVVNLDGPDGNAFNLIGLAIRIMRDSRMTEEEIIIRTWDGKKFKDYFKNNWTEKR